MTDIWVVIWHYSHSDVRAVTRKKYAVNFNIAGGKLKKLNWNRQPSAKY